MQQEMVRAVIELKLAKMQAFLDEGLALELPNDPIICGMAKALMAELDAEIRLYKRLLAGICDCGNCAQKLGLK